MTENCKHYFAGGNTTRGFVGYFDNIINPRDARHIYCIKGGPGVGKSSFMKSVGQRCEKEGFTVSYFHCPSDSMSLDGVLIDDIRIAYLDGTAPHITDPIYPGTADSILDFGRFLNMDKLKKCRDEIVEISDRTNELFAEAKSNLKPVGIIYDNVKRIYKRNENEKAVNNLFSELVSKIFGNSIGSGSGIRKLFLTAITPDGTVSYSEQTLKQKNRYILNSFSGDAASDIISRLAEEAQNREFYIECFYCPIDPYNKIDHLVIPELDCAVTVSNAYHTSEEKENIYDVSECYCSCIDKGSISRAMETIDELIANCVEKLSIARKKHSVLEKFYINSMDYASMTEYASETIEQWLN